MMQAVFFYQLTYYKKMFDFKGKSCRAEFWVPTITNIVLAAFIYVEVMWSFFHADSEIHKVLLVSILNFPSLACTVRRLRDIEKSPWLVLLYFVPYVNFCLLALMMLPGTADLKVPDKFMTKRDEKIKAQREARIRRQQEEKRAERQKVLDQEEALYAPFLAKVVGNDPYMNAYRKWWNMPEGKYYRFSNAWEEVPNPLKLKPAPPYGMTYKQRLDMNPEVKILFDFYEGTLSERGPANTIMVRNEERIQAIENILVASGIPAQQKETFDTTEAPTLEKLNQMADPLKTLFPRPYLFLKYKSDVPEFFKDVETAADKMADFIADIFKIRIEEYYKDYSIIRSGIKGEMAVQDVLNMHADAFIVMHNLRIEVERNGIYDTAEIDTLVLAPNGIFSIEVKNFGASGGDIIIEADGSWYRETTNRAGKVNRTPMKNPFQQNDRHIAILERFINQKLGRTMENRAYVENIITMANDSVHIENKVPGGLCVTRIGSLYSQLTKDRTIRYTQTELETIRDLLEKASIPTGSFKLLDHTEELRSYIEGYKLLKRYPTELYERFVQQKGD